MQRTQVPTPTQKKKKKQKLQNNKDPKKHIKWENQINEKKEKKFMKMYVGFSLKIKNKNHVSDTSIHSKIVFSLILNNVLENYPNIRKNDIKLPWDTQQKW